MILCKVGPDNAYSAVLAIGEYLGGGGVVATFVSPLYRPAGG